MDRTGLRRDRRRVLRGSLALAGVALLFGCGRSSPTAEQPKQQARIGLLSPSSLGTSPEDQAFREALRDLGWVPGENPRIESRWSPMPDGDAAAAAKLIESRVDLIVAAGDRLSRAASEAGPSTPVVMAVSSDPVGSGLVTSLARPGGNVTGLATLGPELSVKRLELLKEVLPSASRVAVVWNATLAERATELRSLEDASRALGLEIQWLPFRQRVGLQQALETASTWPAEAILLLDEPLYPVVQLVLVKEFPSLAVPTFGGYGDFARAGGLLGYGPNLPDLFARAATYVDRILRGSRPADLPVEQPTTFEFVINLKTAEALGLTVPPSVLAQATEVIR
jgi:putative ABC transport system substrate-binding protein